MIGKYLLAGAILVLSGQAFAATATIGNTAIDCVSEPDGCSVSALDLEGSNTYGQVFTAPVSGVMTSFTLRLSPGLDTNMVGVLATWNGTASWATGFGALSVLSTGPSVPTAGGGSFTFAPNVNVTAGTRYVAYVTVFGQQGTGAASMALGDNSDPWLDYFVWNDETDPTGDSSWDYALDFGDAHFDATFGVVPEPQSWALLIAGFGLVGAAARRRRSLAAA